MMMVRMAVTSINIWLVALKLQSVNCDYLKKSGLNPGMYTRHRKAVHLLLTLGHFSNFLITRRK